MSLVEKWLPTAKTEEEAILIIIHETLHETVNNNLAIVNTTFTEALFDVLCGRECCGLWFGKQCFDKIHKFLKVTLRR